MHESVREMPVPSLPEHVWIRLQMLHMARAPRRLLQLVVWVFLAGLIDSELDAAEFFAGDMAITSQLQTIGYAAFPFELKLDNEGHDILTDSGFCFALSLVCKLRRGGLAWFGIVCSTWVFMSRSTTGRHYCAPLGNMTDVVKKANCMTSRVVLLYWLASAQGCLVILEQPSSSLLYMHPRFQAMLRNVPTYLTKVFLGHFHAESPKLVHLYSNMPCVADVLKMKTRGWLPMSQGVVLRSEGPDGREQVSGDSKLKETQSYPRAFGLGIARMYQKNKHDIDRWAENSAARASTMRVDWGWLWGPLEHMGVDDSWADAELAGVIATLYELAQFRGTVV